jgi:hypothetical protein
MRKSNCRLPKKNGAAEIGEGLLWNSHFPAFYSWFSIQSVG